MRCSNVTPICHTRRFIVRNLILLLLVFAANAQAITALQLERLAQQLQVHYTLIDANPDSCPEQKEACYLSELTLSLANAEDLEPISDWAIYFSQLMPIYAVQGEQLAIEHVNGDLHRIRATSQFTGFGEAGVSVRFYTEQSQITRSEFMPNYLISDVEHRLEPQVIASTQSAVDDTTGLEQQPYLQAFTGIKQLRVSDDDKTPWMGAEYLYQHQVRPKPRDTVLGLVPQPQHIARTAPGRLSLSKGFTLQLKGIERGAIEAALKRLATLGVHERQAAVSIEIHVSEQAGAPPESYKLNVRGESIVIQAPSATGAFYGLQSVAGLLNSDDLSLERVAIEDAPHYGFRGLHIDVARNFRTKAFILNTIEQMAAYKLNKLHLHLADDEGWRLAIDGLPELTEVAATRCLDLAEQRCLLPQLGAGHLSDSGVNGFYSAQDYVDILRYAQAHHIEVVPSLDMPGHSRAAIKAMEARHQRLLAQGDKQRARQYRLVEPQDRTQYRSIQHYNDNTLNICLPSTYRFIDKVLLEVQRLHQRAGVALHTYHIGADETAGAWLASPACQQLKGKVADFSSFNGYFIEKISQSLANKGIKVGGWSDGMGDVRLANMPAHVQSNAWATLSDNGHEVAHQHANQGWDVVISSPDVTYFDFPYQSHPQERGNHWASRAVDTRKVFEFMPDNLPAHAEIWRSVKNQPYHADDSESSLQPGVQFAGVQGHLWSEMLRTDRQAEYMLYPRLLALAERAWHKPQWALPYVAGRSYSADTEFFDAQRQQQREQDWQRFAYLVGEREIAKLEKYGRFYRIPTVAASTTKQGYIDAFTLLPGFAIEVQTSDGQWQPFKGNKHYGPVRAIRARSPLTQRRGRALSLQ
ncbi:beta-N-acetylhexosaminidase [Pseudoalteromonas ruthenica]|nr:beta-N-acetylhexosaminidase [Pseudoalteromonas ruthenica]TMO96635.1 beta-N-acetylhexosaminidase [Pseudoalteromonas ruthenica]TMP05835.1 beta-N-acetylhexosaminidase [Pseudoalteromonas ruthenica]TMP05939.1 beta-N-acetylhexosaminidase [Pseudoalteromonas ruthenica]